MSRLFLLLSFAGFALLAADGFAEEEAEKLVAEISLEGVDRAEGFKGTATEPKSAKSTEELTELVGKEGAATLAERIDFETHELVYFQWAGSGQDNITPTENDGAVLFSYKRGLTRDLRQHRAAYAVKKGTAWKVETAPFGRGR